VQLIALTGLTLAAAFCFSSLIISAADLTLASAAQAASRCSARVQLIALTGSTLAATFGFSSLIISAAALALSYTAQAASRRSARVQLIALTGSTLAATFGFSSLIISAAALALGSRSTGRIAPLGTRAADRPDGLDAHRRLQLQLAHHLGRCPGPRLAQHRPHRAARHACS